MELGAGVFHAVRQRYREQQTASYNWITSRDLSRLPPRDKKTQKTQWKKWERIPYPNAGAPTSEG